MILVDYSQLFYAIIFRAFDPHGNIKDASFVEEGEEELSPRLLRHVVLNSILFHKKEFSQEFGELLFCVDAPDTWRKKVFKYYKHKRREKKRTSGLDWDMIEALKKKFVNEIRDDLRFKLLEVPGAEADDVIAVLSKKLCEEEPILILSSDHDFLQLQKYKNVSQYSMSKDKYLYEENPRRFLKEHIIQGDSGDGIPNILSPLNTFFTGVRQKGVCQKKKLPRWLGTKIQDIEDWDDGIKKRFNQNRKLIDFDCIPPRIQERILEHYEEMIERSTRKMSMKESMKFSSYFTDNGLSKLFERISEF